MKKMKELVVAFFNKYKDLAKSKFFDFIIKVLEDFLKYLKK